MGVRIAFLLLMAARVAAQPLDERALENLVTFARVTGCVRYFHPAAATERTNWDAFTAAAISEVERSDDVNALLTRLYPPVEAKANPFLTRTVRWEHRGIVTGPRAPANGFRSARETHWRIGVAGRLLCLALALLFVALAIVRRRALWLLGVVFALPATLSRQPMETWRVGEWTMPLELPAAVADAYPPFVARGTITPRAQRLASVIAVWNVQQHFYPYFDQVQVGWASALRRALLKAAVDGDDAEFVQTLRAMGHDLEDSHAWVKVRGESFARLPIQLGWIEEQLVVTGVADGVDGIQGIRPGDVVQAIDGVPAREAVERQMALTPGSHEQAAVHLAVEYFLVRSASAKTARITLANGTTHELAYGKKAPRPRYAPIVEVAPGILRVDLGAANPAMFNAALPRLANARGIIYVLEIYPHNFPEPIMMQHLVDEPIVFWKMQAGLARWPDRHQLAWVDLPERKLQPLEPRLRARVALIVTPLTVSYAEHIADAVQFYKLGKVVGQPTAGAFGAATHIELPGRIQFLWTASRANRLDGSVLHGRGIVPDVRVARTVAGVRAGRDEVLEAAIAAVR
ncbi:MAG TPA: S41 family peptidase [Thermoanaerobaculia bacterium]